jgi:hypothetical protein
MANVQLVGLTDTSGVENFSANYLGMNKFTADKSGTAKEIRFRMRSNGNIKVGIYSDAAGAPSVLLAVSGSTAATTGINTIAISDVNIIKGVAYWLAMNQDTSNTIGQTASGGTQLYISLAYANSFPNPAGAGYTPNTTTLIMQGWGVEATGAFLAFL